MSAVRPPMKATLLLFALALTACDEQKPVTKAQITEDNDTERLIAIGEAAIKWREREDARLNRLDDEKIAAIDARDAERKALAEKKALATPNSSAQPLAIQAMFDEMDRERRHKELLDALKRK